MGVSTPPRAAIIGKTGKTAVLLEMYGGDPASIKFTFEFAFQVMGNDLD